MYRYTCSDINGSVKLRPNEATFYIRDNCEFRAEIIYVGRPTSQNLNSEIKCCVDIVDSKLIPTYLASQLDAITPIQEQKYNQRFLNTK